MKYFRCIDVKTSIFTFYNSDTSSPHHLFSRRERLEQLLLLCHILRSYSQQGIHLLEKLENCTIYWDPFLLIFKSFYSTRVCFCLPYPSRQSYLPFSLDVNHSSILMDEWSIYRMFWYVILKSEQSVAVARQL